MIRRDFIRLGGALAAIELTATAKIYTPDICVYGGSMAGVGAALQAAYMGKSVLLIDPGQHIGGMSVEGLGSSDIDNHWFQNSVAIGGLAKEFYLRIGKQYGKQGPQYLFESHVAEKAISDWLAEQRVPILRGARITRALKTNGSIRSITLADDTEVRAAMWIDASIEGDLLDTCGLPTFNGREGNERFGETKNGVRAENTYRQFELRIDPYWRPGVPSSGVIPTIQDEPLGNPGEPDRRIQGYCFRMCLTREPKNRLPFAKPAGFDRKTYEIYLRYAAAGGKLWTPSARLPNGKTDLGSWHDLSANLYGMNHAYPTASPAARESIVEEHLHFTQGLVWFLANDPAMPEALRNAWGQWGLCQDEFTDNGGWPRMFYVREARRLVNDHTITEWHTRRLNQTPVSDPVGLSYWPPDTHHVRRIVRDGAAYNEGFVFGGDDWGPFSIPYRSMLPREKDAVNLITPTCLASTHVAYGAIRLEWTFFLLGQSAATAAALAIDRRETLSSLPYPALRNRLLADGQILTLNLPVPKQV